METFFRDTGHLCGEFTGDRWIPRTKANDAELWCVFLICAWINNGKAGDLRRHPAQFDGTVMMAWRLEKNLILMFDH